MAIYEILGFAGAAAIVPLTKHFITEPIRRYVRHGMKDGWLRRTLLCPLGYTKKARDDAATQAVMNDYHLLPLNSNKLR